KNYHLPVEDMLLNNTENKGIVKIPAKSAELALFVIRMILKHGVFAENILIHRKYENVTKELQWLCGENTQTEALKLLENWLPSIGQKFFIDCINALKSKSQYLKRITLSHRMQVYLKNYSRYPLWKASIIANYVFLSQLYRRHILKQRNKLLSCKGFIIAFIGPDASGKSTLAGETKEWLGQNFSVYLFHIGKPTPTLLTIIPNIVLKAVKKFLPKRKKNNIETLKLKNKKNGLVLFIHVLRNLLLAFDRFHLLKKTQQLAQKGNIVICDRYPTSQTGAMDSPRLAPADFNNVPLVIKKLIDMENKIYIKILPPDLAISLKVPLELAIDRNLSRKNKEIESYLRTRHNQWKSQLHVYKNVHEIHTNNSFHETLLKVKKTVWENIPG
ncbi:MAG: hypothetical protein PHW62_03540, partial [Candidatus Ratteibacteria bacterium]|nr:hypothetical protein [Candidatus Ratteibacteria bacterium]